MNHPRYEKLHLGCSCSTCCGRERIRKNETFDQFKSKCKKISWYTNNPDEVEKDYIRYTREASYHRVKGFRRNRRRQVAKQIRLAYKNNLKKSLDFGDNIVKISLGYTD